MSRSYRHTPIMGWHVGSEKYDKQLANRKRRRRNHVRVARGEEPILDREAYDMDWSGNKDGKGRFDAEQYPKGMRK